MNYHMGATMAALAAMILCSGCGVELLTTTAVQGELQAKNAKAATQQLDLVKGRVGALNVNQAIQAYRAENGSNPPSLDALVPKYLPSVPTQANGTPYDYDPATGKLAPGYGVASSGDQEMIVNIKNAIHRYGTATGYYPPTLDTLYPDYLPKLPRTASGAQFVYNNQNGEVRLPGGTAASMPIAAEAPRGGLSPVGQALTGAGLQESLGNGSAAGATSARSHARGMVEDISNQTTNRQNQAMDQLGL